MKAAKKLGLSILLFTQIHFVSGQQNSLFNTYAMDPLQLNIAYSGAVCTEANLHYRTQWIGMKEAPKIFQLNAHTALGKTTGLGLRLSSQSIGLLNNLSFTGGYSYRFMLKENLKVHLGIGVGWSQASINAPRAVVIDPQDVTLSGNNRQTANGFDSEFGAMIFGENLKAGVSALHLYNTNPDFTGNSGYKVLPQINSQVSYVFQKGKKIEFEPWILNRLTLRGDNVIEGIMKVNFLGSFTAGAGYRSRYGLLVLLGAQLSRLKIAYSLDYGANKNAVNLGTSHQIMVGFSLCKKEKPQTESGNADVSTNPMPPEKNEAPTNIEAPLVQEQKPDTLPIAPKIEVLTVEETQPKVATETTQTNTPPPEERAKTETEVSQLPPQAQMQQDASQNPEKVLPVPIEELNSVVTKVIFPRNSIELSDENRAIIKDLSEMLKKGSGNIVIVGYASTDGDKAHNLDLAIHRAEIVKQTLVKFGVPAKRMSLKNGGATDAVNKDPDGNRTVRFELLPN